MYHKDSFIIHPETFRLIQAIQGLPEFNRFYLAGGTALALQYGHRNSIDIDLFTQEGFESDELIDVLRSHFDVEVSFKRNNGTLLTFINNVKTDFIRHNYPLVKAPCNEENITFLVAEDIAAMKINAIINSGKRLKDFVDIYFLLEKFSLNEIMTFFSKKYPHMNPLIALKSLAYFEDIDPEIDPPKTRVKLPMSKVLDRVNLAILESNRLF